MNEHLSISDQGLRLIKAFEGFRPVDRERVSGGRVVGYGHRLRGGEAMTLNREEAHELLLDDLAPFQDMLNERVHAALTQSQFDALASFAFNVGPKAFLESDVYKAVNAGRPLEAAQALDAYRLANVSGETFVVDALVRRRTAEKSLFLRPPVGGLAPKASRLDLAPQPDARVRSEDTQEILDRDGAGRLVSDAPYDIQRLITPQSAGRRRDDARIGDMVWSERPATSEEEGFEESVELHGAVSEDDEDDTRPVSAVIPPGRTAIADAADEVRDRLNALIDAAPAAPPIDNDASESPLVANANVLRFPTDTPQSGGADADASVAGELENDPAENDPAESDLIEGDARGLEGTAPSAYPPRVLFGKRSADAVTAPGVPGNLSATSEDAPSFPVRPSADADVRGDWVQTRLQPHEIDVPDTSLPYVFLIMAGGAMSGAGAMVLWRGLERALGLSGEFVGLSLLMVGALILAGGLAYLLKRLIVEAE